MKDSNITSQSMIPPKRSKRLIRGEKLRDAQKVEKIPVKIINADDKLKNLTGSELGYLHPTKLPK